MTKTTTVASKAFVAVVAAAMVFSLIAPAAKAATAEELQAQIAALMAQISALQGGGNTTTTTTTTTSTCVAIPAPLTMNATGVNVTALQNWLIKAGQSIPAGATGYFGAQTRSALAAWQSANGVMPAVGYYGPITAAAVAAKCVPTTPTTPGTGTGTTPTTPGSTTLKGEADLDKFEIDDAADTDVSEGDEEVEIGMFTVEFTDGDADISRMDIMLKDAGGTSSNAWDTFESIQLTVDGKVVAEADAGSKDDYLGDEDDGIIRFSDLDLIAMEDEEIEIMVTATIQDNLDAENLGDWALKANSLRFFDADDVATTDTTTGDLDNSINTSSPKATFTIEVAGQDEELKFSLASGNPDASDILVDENSTTNNVTILEYKIKAEDGDIDLNELFVTLVTTDMLTDVISDIEIDVDGQVFNDDSVVYSVSTTTGVYKFDIDGDVTIDADDEVIVKVTVDLKRQAVSTYPNGTTIKAEVTSVNADATDAEGADDLTTSQISGAAIGKVHTLVAAGLTLDVNTTSAVATINNTTANDSFGEFKINFDVTAVENTAFVALTAARATGTEAAIFVIEDANGVATTTGTVTQSLTRKSGGSVSGGYVEIAAGDTAVFELVVTYNPALAGQFRLQLLNVGFAATAVPASVADRATAIPAEDYETSNTLITS